MPALIPRYLYNDCYYNDVNCEPSAWNRWIRWVVLVVVILFFLALFVGCSCLTARRRRRAGRQPFYGTGWAARPGQYNSAQPYYNNQPAPPYTAQPDANHGYYGPNNGYYGQNGTELQSPQPVYHQGGEYAPPPGPPPAKGDGIVR